MSRTYRPAIAYEDGSNEFVLTNPQFTPVSQFEPSLSRRHHPSIIARRDGARAYLPGKLGVQKVVVSGSFGGGMVNGDTSHAEGLRDIFTGQFMQKDETLRLYRYADRYAKARLMSASFPMGRQILDLEQNYTLKFDLYDPYWYDSAGDQTVSGEFVLNTDSIIFTIGGNAPTPVQMQFIIESDCTTLFDATCIWNLYVQDVGQQARTGKAYWELNDNTCCIGAGAWDWNPGDEYHTITGPSDCTAPLQAYGGYWFHSGPGDTTITFTTPGVLPAFDCTVSYVFTWTNRWYVP